jgi:flagellar assembly protein FliH
MNTFTETVKLSRPLRHVAPIGLPPELLAQDPSQQEAWQRGYHQGRIDGEKGLSEQLVKQRGELHELMQGALTSLQKAVPQVIRDTETMVVSLALEVARKLVCDMPINAEMVAAAVRDALAHAEGSAQVTVRLHPADLELLQASGSPLLTTVEGSNSCRFLSSMEVSRGGCMVETRFGTIDARRETKFDLVKKTLTT